MPNTSIALPGESIEDTILLIRGKRVILDHDLARLYGVATRSLNQAVKRNLDRFPEDFMFQLTKAETEECQRLKPSRSQIVILNKTRGTNIKYQPYAFTEHGILMLSSVLKSQRAVQVNIQIMRTFVRLRQMLASNETLIERLDELDENYDELCLKSSKLHLDTVSTTRGSGWVDVKPAIFPLIFESRRLTHPLPRVVLTVSNNDSRLLS
jgi:hypothetical protein